MENAIVKVEATGQGMDNENGCSLRKLVSINRHRYTTMYDIC